jgi:PAS domain S-box-containing protein
VLRRRSTGERDELETRARQQAAVADLGQRALAGMALEELLDAAAHVAASELGAEVSTVLELTGDGEGLLIRAGHTLPEGALGGVVPASDEGLVRLGADLGAASTLTASISARNRHFGALAVHRGELREYTREDRSFLQAVANVVGAAVDRARTEDQVRDSEARFRDLADTTPALMWTTDAEGHVSFVNEGWLRFTGRTLDDEIGDTFGSSAHPDDRERLLAEWRRAFDLRAEFRIEYRLEHADGGHRWVLEVGTPRFAGGEFLGYVGTATDIHERRAMEETLRRSEQAFRELADTAPVMIWTTDERGLVTFVNEGWMRYTGTTIEEELGQTMALGVHPEDSEGVLESWGQALEARRPWEREYRLRRHDGEYRWIVDRAVPMYREGRYEGYVGTAADIHERKLMEVRLREVYEREHSIAEALQRSLLPERLPDVEALELAARYLPAGRGAAVGGDWYDVFELGDGRVALVVGDVVGHGLRAAAVMGQMRNAFRAYGLVEGSPAEVMARVNRLVMSGVEDAMATVLYLVLDRDTGEIVYTSAGHPPPLVLSQQGAQFLEGGRSMPLGASDQALYREETALLPHDATLLLYTDGLVERRDVSLDHRLAQLAAAATAAGGELPNVCDEVLSGVLGLREPADDVALLAVRPQTGTAERISLTLPAEPEALAALRRRVGRFLAAAGANEIESYEIVLTVCEAAGNAIEHAYGPGDASFEVEVAIEGGDVVAEVSDTGQWRDRRGEHRGRGLTIIEGLMDSVDVRREPGGTVVRMRRRLTVGAAA